MTIQEIKTPNLILKNNTLIPQIGLGVLKAKNGGEVEQAVSTALENGYRMIDTASKYGNEEGVGLAIKNSDVPRNQIFLTTKIWNSDQGYKKTLLAFEESLNRLQTDYVDLLLIHWPVEGKFIDTWKALEDIYKSGLARAIGVSNFHIHHLKELMEHAEIIPMVNQVEVHPHLQQNELVSFSKANGIQIQAWRPIMMGEVAHIDELQKIALKYSKSTVQVALRWLIQRGIIVLPKSVTDYRIKENIDIFDFELTKEEMTIITSLNQNKRLGPDPDNFNF